MLDLRVVFKEDLTSYGELDHVALLVHKLHLKCHDVAHSKRLSASAQTKRSATVVCDIRACRAAPVIIHQQSKLELVCSVHRSYRFVLAQLVLHAHADIERRHR